MTRSRTPRDLRERMERVAAKSRRPPESGTVRRAAGPAAARDTHDAGPPPAPADATSASTKSAPHKDGSPPRGSGAGAARQHGRPPADVPGTEPRSRAETLLAWGLWEVTEVPAQRWKWFKTAIRGGETKSKQRKRGG